jgi:hypothetical protein
VLAGVVPTLEIVTEYEYVIANATITTLPIIDTHEFEN